MASSSSPPSQRRRPLRKRQSLTRHNSSFLGTIKNLVTAPLSWFTGTDDFDDSKDLQGKRRRLVVAPTEPDVSEDDRLSRNKRMRVHSPPRDEPMTSPAPNGYLDPPGSVFVQHQHRPSVPSIQPAVTRSASLTKAYDLQINNSNFIRGSTPLRTMSVDPPARSPSRTYPTTSIDAPAHPLSRTYAIASISNHRDSSMGSSGLVTGLRDMSMPPLSTHSSFHMRTSFTPQPPLRETSEPPPITTLNSNPTFIRPPKRAPNGLSGQPSITLGTLIESVRSTHSPVRQHSSLVFGSHEELPSSRLESAVEKALHELDIYKTPLVPTRLRSSNLPSVSSSSDLFKPRRNSPLVLMQDDKRTGRLGSKANNLDCVPVVNETKPYAGEGGMKKLLARRKREIEQEGKSTGSKEDEDYMDDGEKGVDKHGSSYTVPPVPPPSEMDDLAAREGATLQKSSLRVGRTKARGHITRPIRPTKTKFSAAFDDDGMEDVDEMHEEIDKRKKEREELEEAAKHVPVFQIPEGFSFAKEANPIKVDPTNDKEPPIKALPFSIIKPKPGFAETLNQQPNILSPPEELSQGSMTAKATAKEVHDFTSKPTEAIVRAVPAISTSTTPVGMPKFFATSAILAKPMELPKPTPLVFSTLPANQPSFPVLTKNADNLLWVGGNAKLESATSIDGLPVDASPKEATTQSGQSHSISAFAPLSMSSPGAVTGTNIKQDVAPQTDPLFKSSEPFISSLAGQASQEVTPVIPAAPLQVAPRMVTSHSVGPVGEQAKVSPFQEPSFDKNAPKLAGLFSSSPKITPSPAPPYDGSASTTDVPKSPSGTASTSIEFPKSLFGNGGFSFGNVDGDKAAQQGPASFPNAKRESVTATFAFDNPSISKNMKSQSTNPPFMFSNGSTSTDAEQKPPNSLFTLKTTTSASPTEAPKSAPFSFEASTPTTSVAPPTSIGFSFSASGSKASDISSKPFTFGHPTVVPLTERPSTPPRSQDQEISMEESPTRDVQVNKPPETSAGFSFGSGVSGSSSGVQNSGSSTLFSFGPSSAPANPFAKDNKPAENKTFALFGQNTAGSGSFTFGQPKPSDDRASNTGPFSFGNASTSTTGAGPTFSFGNPGNNPPSGVFGQPQPGSAPNSPSTFNQLSPSPFTFGAPLPPVNTAFTFGPQPASPAGGSSVNLPPPATPGGFGSVSGTTLGQQPASPFGTPIGAPTTLFTIGSAPAQIPTAGARQIRKLPNRRGTVKR